MTRSSRWLAGALIVFGLVLHAPMALSGFFADDYVHQLFLSDDATFGKLREPWQLFDFGERSDWAKGGLAEEAFPWWTAEDWKVRFFRPVASLSIAFDRLVFGRWALGYHLTSLGLYALLLALMLSLYRRLGLGEPAARLALFLFLLGDATAFPVGWIANRNSLLMLLFTVAAVHCVADSRSAVRRSALVLALVYAALAALSKESGVVAFVLVGAALLRSGYATRGQQPPPEPDRHRARRRLAGLGIALCIALALAHVSWLMSAGFGTRGIFYRTPWVDPSAFLGRAGILASVGLVSLASPLPLGLPSLHPELLWPSIALCIVVLAAALPWLARRLAGQPAVGFLGLWVAALLLPQAAAPPDERLLFAASVGSAALLALAIRSARSSRARSTRVVGLVLLLLGTIGSGAALLGTGYLMFEAAADVRQRAVTADVGSPSLGFREVFVLQAENAMSAFTLGPTFGFESEDHELAFHLLQIGSRPLRWTRIDESSFELESLGSPFLQGMFERLYRTTAAVPALGSRWVGAGFEVEATAVEDGGLRAVRVRLDAALDTPRYRFLVPEAGRFVAVDPPPIGQSLELPAPTATIPLLP